MYVNYVFVFYSTLLGLELMQISKIRSQTKIFFRNTKS